MKKHVLRILILILCVLYFAGCSQPVTYSEKFEGIPIYPGMELLSSSEHEEYYETLEFDGTFKDVKEFYLENIDKEKWSIEKNSHNYNNENSSYRSQGYILNNGEKEVYIILDWMNFSDGTNRLNIIINGSPLKEGKYRAKGQSENWEASLEYIFTKRSIRINGYVIYIGEKPPKEVDSEFLYYDIVVNPPSKEGFAGESSSSESFNRSLEGSKITISEQSDRHHEHQDLHILKEAINNAYIELKWEEQGEEKLEKVEISVVP